MNDQRDQSWLRDRRVIVFNIGCAMAGFLEIPGTCRPDWGDIPTWLAVIVATIGGWTALAQLRQQQAVIKDDIERQAKRDKLLDTQLREAADWARSRVRVQAELVEFSGRSSLYPARKGSGDRYRTGHCTIKNGSGRPVWDVAPRLVVNGEKHLPVRVPRIRPRMDASDEDRVASVDVADLDKAAGRYPILRPKAPAARSWPVTAGWLVDVISPAMARELASSERGPLARYGRPGRITLLGRGVLHIDDAAFRNLHELPRLDDDGLIVDGVLCIGQDRHQVVGSPEDPTL